MSEKNNYRSFIEYSSHFECYIYLFRTAIFNERRVHAVCDVNTKWLKISWFPKYGRVWPSVWESSIRTRNTSTILTMRFCDCATSLLLFFFSSSSSSCCNFCHWIKHIFVYLFGFASATKKPLETSDGKKAKTFEKFVAVVQWWLIYVESTLV